VLARNEVRRWAFFALQGLRLPMEPSLSASVP
jgi:hypothetical protein